MNAVNVNKGNNMKFLLQMLRLKLTGNHLIVIIKPAWTDIICQGILYKVIEPTVGREVSLKHCKCACGWVVLVKILKSSLIIYHVTIE